MGRGRAQSSLEYLIIVGIALGLLVPAVFFFASYSKSRESSGTSAQINEIGLQIVSTASETYALGKNARRQVDAAMPAGVRRIYVSGTELIIVYETQKGISEAVFFASVPLVTPYSDGNVSIAHAGLTHFRMTSLGLSVNVSEVSG
jgi:hypothetical protein